MSLFNLDTQNNDLDSKITAGLERLSQVFKVLLWEKAKEHQLSPIQIQLLIFIANHCSDLSTVSYMAQEFGLTKPTISDAVKTLEQKKLVTKRNDKQDTRSYRVALTQKGKNLVADCSSYPDALSNIVAGINADDKQALWRAVILLIEQMNRTGIIAVQRMCYNCNHYSRQNGKPFCMLLNKQLLVQDIRHDCPEFESLP